MAIFGKFYIGMRHGCVSVAGLLISNYNVSQGLFLGYSRFIKPSRVFLIKKIIIMNVVFYFVCC